MIFRARRLPRVSPVGSKEGRYLLKEKSSSCFYPQLVSCSDFDNVIVDRAFNFLEPMRGAVWNDDDVTLGNHTSLSAFGFGAANFFRLDSFRIDDGSAGDESRRAFEHVDDVRVARVNFDDTCFVTVAGIDFVIVTSDQRHSFNERLAHLLR